MNDRLNPGMREDGVIAAVSTASRVAQAGDLVSIPCRYQEDVMEYSAGQNITPEETAIPISAGHKQIQLTYVKCEDPGAGVFGLRSEAAEDVGYPLRCRSETLP